MDPVQLLWLVGGGALVGGAIIGAIAYRNLTPTIKEASNLKAELDLARRELDSYKSSVNSHFDKTSELVNELTQDYVKVYKHLAEGAQVLGDSKDFTHVLQQHQGKVLISVDDHSKARDKIVSEAPADTVQSQESEPGSSAPSDTSPAQENIADSQENTAAEVEESASVESMEIPGDKKEPVIDADKPVVDETESDPVKTT
ncbi:MAG: DUF1043 family protein [Gammaproteobacteria bacterium]|nr:DUF1043 family protein [Gammaproteobacteria bacterium]